MNNHLLSTIDTLINDASNKLWRARVGACSALAEVIVGRTWNDLGGGGPISLDDYLSRQNQTAASRLLILYRVTVRALDDVRLTVRESGEVLSRSVRGLTIRLCDSSSEGIDTFSSVAAATTVLPWLLKHGLNSPCQEAVGFTISCLLGMIEVAKSKTLERVLPELIGSLLMAMSGLEPAALNYLQTRAAGQNSNRFEELERLRLQMAQSGPISGALTKCLEMVKSVESDEQRSAIIPHIDSALRCGAGFATRAGMNVLIFYFFFETQIYLFKFETDFCSIITFFHLFIYSFITFSRSRCCINTLFSVSFFIQLCRDFIIKSHRTPTSSALFCK